MNKLFLWTLSLVICSSALLPSCSKQTCDGQGQTSGGIVAVDFTAAKITTRFCSYSWGDSWSIDDKIGLFAQSESGVNYSNVEYSIANAVTGQLTAVDRTQQIFVEEDESCDYLAYYPFNESVPTASLAVDLLDQSDLSALAILRSEAVDITDGVVNFEFQHVLSKLSLEIQIAEDNTTLESLVDSSVTIKGVTLLGEYAPYTNEFSDEITYQATLPLTIAEDGKSATAEALVIPMADLDGAVVYIYTANGDYEYIFANNAEITEWESGCSSSYTVKL